MRPPLPEHEIPFVTEGRSAVLLVYPVETTPAWHRPLCIADALGSYAATAVMTMRQVHVLKGPMWLRYPVQRVLHENRIVAPSDTP